MVLNILLVDSFILNTKVIEQDSSSYLENCNIQYNFYEASNPSEAFDILDKNKIDIVYIDISSEDFDGIKLLKDIQALNFPSTDIIAVTVLYDKEYKYKALKLGVYKYIYKPYDYKEIEESLEKFFTTHNEFKQQNKVQDDDPFEFDFDLDEEEETQADDDGFDFDFDMDEPDDTSNTIEHNQELMDAYNKSHKKVSSEEFLESYSDVVYDTEELLDLEDDLDALVASILFEDDLSDKIPDIVNILEKYDRFLYLFSEFEELCKVIYSLVELLEHSDLEEAKSKKMSSKLIVAIIEDLIDWKDHVFIEKDAVDVFYINASILNSYILLKDILK